jgi:hypothetical protein
MWVRAAACALTAMGLAGAGIAVAADRPSRGHATCGGQSSAGFPNAYGDAGGRAVTFWSGFVLATAPRCLHLKIWIDGARTPRRASMPIGRRC